MTRLWRLRPWREVKRLRLACALLEMGATAAVGQVRLEQLNDALAEL